MRIVMRYIVSDGYTFSCTETIPIEYESVEAAIVEFETRLKQARVDYTDKIIRYDEFTFAGKTFHSHDFYFNETKYELPQFLTLDEWFSGSHKI